MRFHRFPSGDAIAFGNRVDDLVVLEMRPGLGRFEVGQREKRVHHLQLGGGDGLDQGPARRRLGELNVKTAVFADELPRVVPLFHLGDERPDLTHLLAIALLSPVIYPWYLLWGLLCLAPITRGLQRNLVLLACAIASVLALPGLPGLPADLLAAAFAVLAVILLVATGDARVGLAAAVATARRTARGRRPPVRSEIERTPR